MRGMKDLQENKSNGVSVIIPRLSGKRLTVIAKVMQLAEEWKRVTIFDIGGQGKVLEPVSEKEVIRR